MVYTRKFAKVNGRIVVMIVISSRGGWEMMRSMIDE